MQINRIKTKYLFRVAVCLILIGWAGASPAQDDGENDEILIIADDVKSDPEANLLTATGDVEVYFDGKKLTAPKVVYNLTNESVMIEGPFVLSATDGSEVVYGDFADLSADMANGVIQAVRYVLDHNLQVTASESVRSEGRFSEFKRVRASSCKICIDSQIPLWEIQAKDAIHDNKKQQVTYKHAKLLIRGIPIAYVPWLRMPDPSVKRADGFLFPKLRFNTALGNQFILPYFKTLGESADITLSPNIALTSGRKDVPRANTLEARFRQKFQNGYLELNGALSSDTVLPDQTRSYLFSNGEFKLANDVNLKFQTQAASDKKYIASYDFFNNGRETFIGRPIAFEIDRLNNKVEITRAKGHNSVSLSYQAFKPLLAPDHKYETANIKFDFHWLNQGSVNNIPGKFQVSTAYLVYENDFGPTNVRTVDLTRSSINVFWNNTVSLNGSLTLQNDLGFLIDSYSIKGDNNYDNNQSGLGLFAASKLSWPITLWSGANYNTTFSPSLEFVTNDFAEFNIPINNETNIGLLDPYNVADIGRFNRLKRDQNFNHQLSYLNLDLPFRQTIFQNYFLGIGLTQDKILYSDAAYPLENGLIYKSEMGKSGPGVNFSIKTIYNESGKKISDNASIMIPVRQTKFEAKYLKRDKNQVFYKTDQIENWSLGFSANLFNRIKIKADSVYDTINSDKSISSASLEYSHDKTWRASFDTVYNRYYERRESQNISLGYKFNWGGELFYTRQQRIETSDRSTFGFNFDNECVKFRADYSRSQNLLADTVNMDEFTIMIRLGSFGSANTRHCD